MTISDHNDGEYNHFNFVTMVNITVFDHNDSEYYRF
jgi:hypothetical protein